MSEESAPSSRREANARRLIQVGASLVCFGVTLAVAGDDELSRWLVVVGFGCLVAGLHRFGRLGADPPLDLSLAKRE